MFVFKFEKIKLLKNNLMNMEILKLENTNQKIKEKINEINDLYTQISQLFKKFDNSIDKKTDFTVLKFLIDNIDLLRSEIKTKQIELETLKQQKDMILTVIKGLHKEIKKFEKLKEHYKEQYNYEEKLKETNFINDINAIFYNRRS